MPPPHSHTSQSPTSPVVVVDMRVADRCTCGRAARIYRDVIAFATLLLGLIVGPQPVELLVGESVASVELFLDSRPVATLQGSPWAFVCDFGQELEPHELLAIGFDADGSEVGRSRQWINMPRRPAEAAIALEGGKDGEALIAHLTWESVVDAEPISISVTLDGKPLPVTDPHRIELPSFDTDQLHHFLAELEFSDNVSSVVEATFAGTYVDRVNTELTAVPIVLDKKARLPALESFSGRFTKDSSPLTVVAAEEGPAEVVVVRDEEARKDLNRLLRKDQEALWRRARGGSTSDRASVRTRLPLPVSLKIRYLWPTSDRRERSGYHLDIFPPSREFTSRDGGLFWLLTYVRKPLVGSQPNRYADAVAAAGLLAAGRNRRRAVVLLLGEDAEAQDTSQFDLAAASDYLDTLGVPLFVWSTSRDAGNDEPQSKIVDVSSLSKLGDAARDLYASLERQRIVWLNGTHRPQDIVLNDEGLRAQLVR